MKKLLLIALTALLISCTSSSGDNNDNPSDGGDDNGLSTNACSSLGLSTRVSTTRIVNGTDCNENNSPVVELLLTLPDGRTGTCTGNMLTSTEVLTAAHCFFDNPVEVIATASGVSARAIRVISHPQVSVSANGFVTNDAAIVRLASPVNLPTLPVVLSRAPKSGDEIKIFGYGITEDQTLTNNTTGTLRSGEMKVSEVNSDFVSADFNGDDGSNTCSGDSGGPALLEFDGKIGIIGVLSTGAILECTAGDTSRFTNLQTQSVISFITSNAPGVKVI